RVFLPFRMDGWRSRSRMLGCALIAMLGAKDAYADERAECAAAYEQTQRLQQKSELIAALDAAERCARATCPSLLRNECARWGPEIDAKLPGIVIRVRGSDGCMHDDATLSLTTPTRKDPDSETILLDPGVHEIKVTDPSSSEQKTQTINFAPGERRDIDVDFA